jgi:hypothetical protein
MSPKSTLKILNNNYLARVQQEGIYSQYILQIEAGYSFPNLIHPQFRMETQLNSLHQIKRLILITIQDKTLSTLILKTVHFLVLYRSLICIIILKAIHYTMTYLPIQRMKIKAKSTSLLILSLQMFLEPMGNLIKK